MTPLYIIAKLFTYVVLPPGGFIAALMVSIKKHYKLIIASVILSLYLLSITPVSNLLLEPLETPYMKHSHRKADLVVVLGGSGSPIDPIKTGEGTFKRLMYGLIIAKENDVPMIFSGGATKRPSETVLARNDVEMIEKIFHTRVKVYYEKKSLNTLENARYTLKLILKMNLSKNIYLITSAYHMRRSEMIFKKLGFNVVPEAVDFLYDPRPYNFWDFLPQMGNLKNSYVAIHEYFGILEVYLLRWF